MSRLELRLSSCALGTLFVTSGVIACTESIPPPIPDAGASVQFFDAAGDAADASRSGDGALADDGGVEDARADADGST